MTSYPTSSTCNTFDTGAVRGHEVVGSFAAALLQRGRALRSPALCPHCKSQLNGEALIDLGPHGIWCAHCVGRQT